MVVNLPGLWFLLSPPPDPDPVVYRWKLAVAAYYWVGGVLVMFHVLWACGWLTGFVFLGSGFAQASEVTKLQAQMQETQASLQDVAKEIKSQLIRRDIFDTRLRQCQAIRDGNRDAMLSYSNRMQSLQYEYRLINGYELSVPSCDEL